MIATTRIFNNNNGLEYVITLNNNNKKVKLEIQSFNVLLELYKNRIPGTDLIKRHIEILSKA